MGDILDAGWVCNAILTGVHEVILWYCLLSSPIAQRTAYLLISKKPSNGAWGLPPFQTAVFNNFLSHHIVCHSSNWYNACQRQDRVKPNLSFNLSISVPRRSMQSSSLHVFTLLQQTKPETLEIPQRAEVFQTTLQVLKNKAGQIYKRDLTATGSIAFVNPVELLYRQLDTMEWKQF